MADDLTSVKYKCPFCEETRPTERDIRRHVKFDDSSKHQGVNGFTMDETIQVIHEDNGGEKKTTAEEYDDDLEDRIIQAADRVEMNGKGIKQIAEKADVHHSYVKRIWDDNDIEYDYWGHKKTGGKTPSTTWDDLTDGQVKILIWHYHHPNMTIKALTEKGGYSSKTHAWSIINNYDWLLQDKYRPEWVDDYFKKEDTHDGEERLENTIDEILASAQEHGVMDDTSYHVSPEVETEENEDTIRKMNGINYELIEALHDSNVEYEIDVDIKEDEFDVMSKLIKNGYDDIAREMFEG